MGGKIDFFFVDFIFWLLIYRQMAFVRNKAQHCFWLAINHRYWKREREKKSRKISIWHYIYESQYFCCSTLLLLLLFLTQLIFFLYSSMQFVVCLPALSACNWFSIIAKLISYRTWLSSLLLFHKLFFCCRSVS